jgi:hypothetical protein
MAKKSYKQRTEKVQVGCMSGLIRMFDFRRGQKYLSDGSRRIDTYSGEELSDIPYLHYTCKI